MMCDMRHVEGMSKEGQRGGVKWYKNRNGTISNFCYYGDAKGSSPYSFKIYLPIVFIYFTSVWKWSLDGPEA